MCPTFPHNSLPIQHYTLSNPKLSLLILQVSKIFIYPTKIIPYLPNIENYHFLSSKIEKLSLLFHSILQINPNIVSPIK
jgi:hypothetical protein